jgi:hypothetical protein
MHFCTAKIMLGGDSNNVMHRDVYSPLSWPEISVLRLIHGDPSVLDVVPFATVPQQPRYERQRLSFIYGEGPLAGVWGGRNAPDEMEAPEIRPKAGTVWRNPLSGVVEITTEDGSEPADPTQLPSWQPMDAAGPLAAGPLPVATPTTFGDPRPAPQGDEPDPFEEDGAIPDRKLAKRR